MPQGNVLLIVNDPDDEDPHHGVIAFDFMQKMEFLQAFNLVYLMEMTQVYMLCTTAEGV